MPKAGDPDKTLAKRGQGMLIFGCLLVITGRESGDAMVGVNLMRPFATPWRLALAVLAALSIVVASGAQAQQRAEPVTGPGVVTIGNMARDARVNLRSGPAGVFPSVATLGYGTRVTVGQCIALGQDRWCQIQTVDGKASGFLNARYLVQGGTQRPPGGGEADDGGPDYLAVRGLRPGDRLNVLREPSPQSPALATLREGEVVRNLGCRMNGAARWCRIRSTTGMDVTGWVAGRYLREAAGPPAGGGGSGAAGPDAWVVAGLAAGDTLNVRTEPSTQGRVIATLQPGARVANLGCRQSGSARWCQIRTTGGVTVTGWVNGRYLREG
jgi:uncharacterized protein YraI